MIATDTEEKSIWGCPGLHHYVLFDENSKLPLAEKLKMEEVHIPLIPAFIAQSMLSTLELHGKIRTACGIMYK